MKIPLSEHFHSIQGEGTWVGTPMHFFRLPGCSVGQLVKSGDVIPASLPQQPTLSSGKSAWLCHRFDGQPFWCDTDFNKYEEVELEDLFAETWEHHICITGGEPLIHMNLVKEIILHGHKLGKMIHIETSGTIDYNFNDRDSVWVTVSPKQKCTTDALMNADELKLLVNEQPFEMHPEFLEHLNVFVSPINPARLGIDATNLKAAMEILKQHPSWKLSVQLHKYLELR